MVCFVYERRVWKCKDRDAGSLFTALACPGMSVRTRTDPPNRPSGRPFLFRTWAFEREQTLTQSSDRPRRVSLSHRTTTTTTTSTGKHLRIILSIVTTEYVYHRTIYLKAVGLSTFDSDSCTSPNVQWYYAVEKRISLQNGRAVLKGVK